MPLGMLPYVCYGARMHELVLQRRSVISDANKRVEPPVPLEPQAVKIASHPPHLFLAPFEALVWVRRRARVDRPQQRRRLLGRERREEEAQVGLLQRLLQQLQGLLPLLAAVAVVVARLCG